MCSVLCTPPALPEVSSQASWAALSPAVMPSRHWWHGSTWRWGTCYGVPCKAGILVGLGGGQPGGLVLVMSKQRCFIRSNRDPLTQPLKHSQKEGQHTHGGLTEGDTEARGIHETCQEHILDRTMFDNSRQAFSSPEIHTCPEIDFI